MGVKEVFAANVRLYRKAAGYTQEQLAEKVGLHRTYIGRIEQRRANVTLKNICLVAEALEIDPALLFIDNATLPPSALPKKGAGLPKDLFALVEWSGENVSVKPLDARYDDLTIKVLNDLIGRGLNGNELLDAYHDSCGKIADFMGRSAKRPS